MLCISSFFKYSTYIGHSASNSIILSSWFFYKLKQRIWVINLFKTIIFIKLVFKFLKNLATFNFPFWFVNLELSKEYLFKKYALTCGEFACTKMWIRGFLSNFKSIQKALGKYVLKRHLYKFSEKNNLIKTWALTRFSWPRGIFLSNVPINYVICKEAASVLLPVVALVDTNIKSYLFNFPIPSNDDSLNSINFFLSILSKHLLLCKYKKIVNWYNKYKYKSKKIINSEVYKKLKLYINKKLKIFYRSQNKDKRKILLGKLKRFNVKRLTKNAKKYLRKYFFVRNFWKSTILYTQLKLLHKRKFKKMIFFSFVNKTNKFLRNCSLLTKNVYHDVLDSINTLTHKGARVYHKFNYLRKLNRNNKFYKKFLLINNFNLQCRPLDLYAKTIRLKHLRFRWRKKNSLKKIYYYYYFISNFLRKSRIFHESFFVNLPSNFTFVYAFHRYYKPAWYKDNKKWIWYNDNYRYKLNFKTQAYWSTNRYNNMLLKYWKYNKKLSISDSAIVFPIHRWISFRRTPTVIAKTGRFLLNYWLYPFFRRFSVKEKFRWYSSKFFYKEDKTFLHRFHWKIPRKKTPLTTFHYYNNWFTCLLKPNALLSRRKFKTRAINYFKVKKKRRLRRLRKLRFLRLERLHKARMARLKRLKRFKIIKEIEKKKRIKRIQRIQKYKNLLNSLSKQLKFKKYNKNKINVK